MKKKNPKSSESQIQQRAKFAVASKFLLSMRELLNKTFPGDALGMTGVNAALKDALQRAISGDYPDYSLDYALIRVSLGPIPFAMFDENSTEIPASASAEVKAVKFTWKPVFGLGQLKASDRAILVAYHAGTNSTVHSFSTATRDAGEALLNVGFSGIELHTWMAFMSADGKKVSDSFYTGKVITT